MKRLIVIILVIACLACVGFLGYTIFTKKNIEKVELDGQIQTTYFANTNEVNNPNFQDANLKITYKGGTVKYIPLNDAQISVTDFSTSTEKTDGKMKINYKSNVIEINYVVIKNGFYYVNSSSTLVSGEQKSSTNYTESTTREYFNFTQEGILNYYTLKDGKWLLYDGKYLPDYKFDIVNDTINVYLGTEKPYYEITAKSTKNGELVVSATHSEYKNDMESSRIVKSLKYINSRTSATIESSELVYNSSDYIVEENTSYFKLFYNQKLADRRGEILLKLNYRQPFIDNLSSVYVIADESMITTASEFNTKEVKDFNTTAHIWYERQQFEFVYRVYTVA